MKKIIAFIIAALLLLCMVSCGEAGGTPTDATTANPVETQPEPEETTDKVIETEPETGNNDENSNDLEIDFKN